MTAGSLTGSGVSFAHLFRLSDQGGLFEHAHYTQPRLEHGYCVDDIARGLVVAAREPSPSAAVLVLAEQFLALLIEAQAGDGSFHNRCDLDLRWTDQPSLEDCWGRALWGLGAAAVRLRPDGSRVALARQRFERGARRRSPHLRAMVFAGLGAAEVLTRWPDHPVARALLEAAAVRVLDQLPDDPSWPWPEPRLRYANASVPEVLIAAGALLGDASALQTGLDLLAWLAAVETAGDHLSVTPAHGWSAGEPRPGFDQQPIEVAALADACGRAYEVTGEARWADTLRQCRAWFLGANDAGIGLLDEVSGGGCDGLQQNGRNENQGAESTMAMIATLQRCAALDADQA